MPERVANVKGSRFTGIITTSGGVRYSFENGGEYTGKFTGNFFEPTSTRLADTIFDDMFVYGGGGIMPDYFVPQDTTNITSYYRMAVNQGLIVQFAYEYTDENRQTLNKYNDENELAKYLRSQNIVEQFVKYADDLGLKRRNIMIQKSQKIFDRVLVGNIIYIMLDDEQYAKFLNQDDPTVLKAVDVFKKGDAKPKLAPVQQDSKNTARAAGIFTERKLQPYRMAYNGLMS